MRSASWQAAATIGLNRMMTRYRQVPRPLCSAQDLGGA